MCTIKIKTHFKHISLIRHKGGEKTQKQKITKLLIPILLCLTLLLCLNLVSAAPGDTIYVNETGGSDSWDGTSPIWTGGSVGPKATIQNGVNTVNSGGTVNVANGTYYEHITITKNLNLTGHSQDDTIIDGTNSGTVITINSGLIVGISNFTIQNGKAEYGGGIYNEGTCTITNCKITQNNASEGGGIYTYGGNCIITGSSITQNNGRWGGGIRNDQGTCNITNCNITQNVASYSDTSGYGGGIYNGGANGICTITGSTIAQNNATYEGGGIFNSFNCTVTDTNIAQNTAQNGNGGGIYNQVASTFTITGSSITQNNAPHGGGIYNLATFIAHFNRIFNNTATGAAFYGESGTANATNNWWGNNTNPTTITDLIVIEGESRIYADPWLIMTFSTNPTTIIQGQTSNLIASFNTNSDNNTVGDANNHIPDGTPVTFTTDSGKVYTASSGVVNSKSVVAYAAGGVATAILDGDAFLTASLDNQTLTETVIIIPGTNGTGNTTVNAATETTATGKTIGMQNTGLPIAGLILAILAVFSGLIVPKRK